MLVWTLNQAAAELIVVQQRQVVVIFTEEAVPNLPFLFFVRQGRFAVSYSVWQQVRLSLTQQGHCFLFLVFSNVHWRIHFLYDLVLLLKGKGTKGLFLWAENLRVFVVEPLKQFTEASLGWSEGQQRWLKHLQSRLHSESAAFKNLLAYAEEAVLVLGLGIQRQILFNQQRWELQRQPKNIFGGFLLQVLWVNWQNLSATNVVEPDHVVQNKVKLLAGKRVLDLAQAWLECFQTHLIDDEFSVAVGLVVNQKAMGGVFANQFRHIRQFLGVTCGVHNLVNEDHILV